MEYIKGKMCEQDSWANLKNHVHHPRLKKENCRELQYDSNFMKLKSEKYAVFH